MARNTEIGASARAKPRRRESKPTVTTVSTVTFAANTDETGGQLTDDSRVLIAPTGGGMLIPSANPIGAETEPRLPQWPAVPVSLALTPEEDIGSRDDCEPHLWVAPNGRGGKTSSANPIEAKTGTSMPQPAAATLSFASTLRHLVGLQSKRRHAIKSQSRCDCSCESFIARVFGCRNDDAEESRKAMWKRIAKFRVHLEKGEVDKATALIPDHLDPAEILDACAEIVLTSAIARRTWDKVRSNAETGMRAIARSLRVWPWVASVAGFGELGLAIIVAEARGDLNDFATKEKLWKYLGLAVIEGERQQKKTDKALADKHRYSPPKRAEIWTIADSLFRHQWRGEKDGVPAHALGPYGQVYAHRKANTASRDWTLKHREEDARRIMSKALIRDLWRVWRVAYQREGQKIGLAA